MGKALTCGDCVACAGSGYCNLYHLAVCEEDPACSQYVARKRTYKVSPPDCPECEVTHTESGMVGIVFTSSNGEIRAEGPSLAALDALAYKFCQAVAALRSQKK